MPLFKRRRSSTVSESTSSGEPRCSVCGTTHSQVVKRAEARGAVAIGKGVGVCPTCRKAWCVDHMIRADPHDFMDNEKCPDDRTALDLDWDKPATPEAPWRIGKPVDSRRVLEAIAANDSITMGEAMEAGAVDLDAVRGPLVEKLRDPDLNAQRFGLIYVRNLAIVEGLEPVVAILADPDRERLHMTAVEALRKFAKAIREPPTLQDPRTFERLIALLNVRYYFTDKATAEVLGALRDRRAVPALVTKLRKDSEEMQTEAEAVLRKNRQEVLATVADVLRRIGGPEAEAALRDHPTKD